MPFRRPAEAAYYTPQLPRTRYYTHLYPFMNVMSPMPSFMPRIPGAQSDMQPGVVRKFDPQATAIRQQLPAVVSTPRANAAPMMPATFLPPVQTQMPNAPRMAPTAGFFGAAGSPYNVMRSGAWPGIRSNGGNIRQGYAGAAALIRRVTPGAYTQANVPGGGYAPGSP